MSAVNKTCQTAAIGQVATGKIIPIYRQPSGQGKATIQAAAIACDSALAAHATNGREFELVNLGTTGAAVAGTIATGVGTATTGTFEAWVADTPKEFPVGTANEIDENEYVGVKYTKGGTDTFATASIMLEVTNGVVA